MLVPSTDDRSNTARSRACDTANRYFHLDHFGCSQHVAAKLSAVSARIRSCSHVGPTLAGAAVVNRDQPCAFFMQQIEPTPVLCFGPSKFSPECLGPV